MEEVDVVMEEVDDLMEEVDEVAGRLKYHKQVLHRDAFDVEDIPDSTKRYGGITPLIGGYLLSWIEEYAQLAIDAYHNHLRKKNLVGAPWLEFVRVLKVTQECCTIMRYYITFEVREDGGLTNTYQAVVLRGIHNSVSVQSFRQKPSQCYQGSGNNGQWIWEGHRSMESFYAGIQ